MRAEVARLHDELVRYGLVVWTSGSVSSRVPGADLFVIKPTDVSYDELSPENMILCDLDGDVVVNTLGSQRAPTAVTSAHAYLYRHLPEIGGVVHTHSTYATAWAARGEAVPCVLTAMADEFGGQIPVAPLAEADPLALVDGVAIGSSLVAVLTAQRSRAVLLQNHGVFTVGSTAKRAVRRAVLAEDSARTVHISRQLGEPVPLAVSTIDALYARVPPALSSPSASPPGETTTFAPIGAKKAPRPRKRATPVE
ncbi:class II aldolase/adducin family protein [Subtercola endophyticus]|nr:class II aldolase/adducin family protein [Subtercola endophyticus]